MIKTRYLHFLSILTFCIILLFIEMIFEPMRISKKSLMDINQGIYKDRFFTKLSM